MRKRFWSPCRAAKKQKIRTRLNNSEAGGLTAGGGIQKAYDLARRSFIDGGNNRVILCTDGDFNVGVSSEAELERLIAKERQSGVFLTVLGYGMGNYKDGKLQTLAEKGNGNHAYIDDLQEANRVLVSEFGSTMHTVAKDGNCRSSSTRLGASDLSSDRIRKPVAEQGRFKRRHERRR